MTDTGCQQCAANTYSDTGASSCTKCPDGKISNAWSTSADNCYYGNIIANKRYLLKQGLILINNFSCHKIDNFVVVLFSHNLSLMMLKCDLISAPCSAGDYMTDTGCQQCEANTFCGDGASSCTECPDGTISNAGSTSADNCYYGNI